MKIDDKIKYLDLFLFLYLHPNSNTKKIMESLNKEYQATNKLLKKLVDKKYIVRRKKTGELGGAEWEYSIADKEIEFLKTLTRLLEESLGFKHKYRINDIITDFSQNLPDLIKISNLNLKDPKIIKLKENIEKYFQNISD